MRKYVAQQTYDNFVYPNNNVAVYDNDDIVQNIPTSGVTGTVTSFTATKVGTTMTVSFNYTWTRNGSEVFRTNSDRINLFSVHMMTPSKTYYKPWRLFDVKYVTGTTQNSYTGSYTASVTQAEFGETYTDGVYTFEVRFIGGLNTYVVCQTSSIVSPSNTPTTTRTPTPTPTLTTTPGLSSTPTPTPTLSASAPLPILGYGLTRCDTTDPSFYTTDPISSGQTYFSGGGVCYISTGSLTNLGTRTQISGTVQVCSCG